MAFNLLSLPRELIDLCVDKIYESDDNEARTTLCACSLVCKTLHHRSRTHLFRHISFPGQTTDRLFSRLKALLELINSASNKGIARYVKVLEIIVDNANEAGNIYFAMLLNDGGGILSDVIDAFHGPGYGIKRFLLGMSSTPPSQHAFVNWPDLAPKFQDSIFNLIKSPFLTFLHLGNIHSLPSTFLQNAKLEHLHLSHTNFSPTSTNPNTAELSHQTPLALGCVTMNPADCLDGIAGGCLSHLAHLKTFTSTILSMSHMDTTWEAMKASATSIEALQLDFYENFPPPPKPFDLGQMLKLQNLAVTHTVWMPDEEVEVTTARSFDADVEHIFALLDTPSPASSLKRLDIMITSWQIFPDDDFFTGMHESSQWHKVDLLLTSSKFPALSTVDLFLSLPMVVEQTGAFDQKRFKSKVSDFFKKVLPRLTASQSISLGLDVQVILFGWSDSATANDIDDSGEEVVFTDLLTNS